MSHKAEALTCYKVYEAWLDTQHAVKLKRLQTDSGSEYLYMNLHSPEGHGTVCSLTVHDTPEENGVSDTLIAPYSSMHMQCCLLRTYPNSYGLNLYSM